MVAVGEVEAGAVGDALPERVCPRLVHGAPAHVGHLEPLSPRRAHRRVPEAHDATRQHAEPAVGPSSLASKSICRPRQMPRNGGRRARRAPRRQARCRGDSACSRASRSAREARHARRRGSPPGRRTRRSRVPARRARAPSRRSAGCPSRSRRRRWRSLACLRAARSGCIRPRAALRVHWISLRAARFGCIRLGAALRAHGNAPGEKLDVRSTVRGCPWWMVRRPRRADRARRPCATPVRRP